MQRWIKSASANGGWGVGGHMQWTLPPGRACCDNQGGCQRLSAGTGGDSGRSGRHTVCFKSTGFAHCG